MAEITYDLRSKRVKLREILFALRDGQEELNAWKIIRNKQAGEIMEEIHKQNIR
ncbi:hypothetical protein [Tepidibacillus marianensis]|uniref:hypothetical protein n=1 Tax=Tepidibacillus marianensis TaxID=3131995 RepID=UPI0030CD057C